MARNRSEGMHVVGPSDGKGLHLGHMRRRDAAISPGVSFLNGGHLIS